MLKFKLGCYTYTVFHQDNYTSRILALNVRAQPTRLAWEGVWIPLLVVHLG